MVWKTRCREFHLLLRNELVTQSFEHWKTAPNNERYRPVVKFRKIDEAVLERLQTGAPELDETRPVAMQIEGDDSDDEDLGTEQEGQTQGNHENEHERGQKLAFAIDPQIDIHSHALLDMISVKDVVDQPLPARAKTVAEGHNMSVDEAFDNW